MFLFTLLNHLILHEFSFLLFFCNNPVFLSNMLPSNINSTALSKNNIPLPLSSSESILLAIQNVSLTFTQNLACTPLLVCHVGSLFLTNLRLIYIPLKCNDCDSFFIPLKRILSENGKKISFVCENGLPGFIFLSFSSGLSSLFFSELKTTLSGIITELVEDLSDTEAPLVSELAN